MAAPGPVRYARASGDIDIAYTVFGQGPLDIVGIGGFVTHLDLMWDLPWFEPFLGQAKFGRVIVFDKRGTGLSERSLGFGSLEERSDDIGAVMDAAGSQQAVIFGISEGGPMAMYFAAQNPSRVRGLVLYGTAAKFTSAPGYPVGVPMQATSPFLDMISDQWGTGRAYGAFVQHPDDIERAEQTLASYERSACTPHMARLIMERNFEIDVRPILGALSVPTLVIHCAGDPVVPVELGRYLASNIAGAKYVEIDGDFHGSWRHEDQQKFELPVIDFLSGLGIQPVAPPSHRVLATILFTDIVGSTEQLSGAGDEAWRQILDQHDRLALQRVEQCGGSLVKTTGDGLLATFGRPSAAIEAARSLREAVAGLALQIRAGVHTGEIELRGDDVGGMAVHIGARIAGLAQPGEVWVSRTVKDLVIGSGMEFEDRREHDLKGVPGSWQLFALSG